VELGTSAPADPPARGAAPASGSPPRIASGGTRSGSDLRAHRSLRESPEPLSYGPGPSGGPMGHARSRTGVRDEGMVPSTRGADRAYPPTEVLGPQDSFLAGAASGSDRRAAGLSDPCHGPRERAGRGHRSVGVRAVRGPLDGTPRAMGRSAGAASRPLVRTDRGPSPVGTLSKVGPAVGHAALLEVPLFGRGPGARGPGVSNVRCFPCD